MSYSCSTTHLLCSFEEDFPAEPALSLFEPGKYGLPAVLFGTAYMAFAGAFESMLPSRADLGHTDDSKEERKATWNAGHEVLASRHGSSESMRVRQTRSRRLSEARREVCSVHSVITSRIRPVLLE